MNCDDFLARVARLLPDRCEGSAREASADPLDARLPAAAGDDVRAHLSSCADCRGLVAALAAADPALPDSGLLDAILRETTGAACASARSRLCARLDGELDAIDAELVEGHLVGCAACGNLSFALERAQEALPRLAAIDPGPYFVRDVLARTSRRPKPEPIAARVSSFLARLVQRPRAAWEGAFVATVLFIGPVVAPGSPLGGIPERTLEVVRGISPAQRQAAGELRGAMSELEVKIASGARIAIAGASATIHEDSTRVAAGLARRSAHAWDAIRRQAGTFGASAASGQENSATERNKPAPDSAEENR